MSKPNRKKEDELKKKKLCIRSETMNKRALDDENQVKAKRRAVKSASTSSIAKQQQSNTLDNYFRKVKSETTTTVDDLYKPVEESKQSEPIIVLDDDDHLISAAIKYEATNVANNGEESKSMLSKIVSLDIFKGYFQSGKPKEEPKEEQAKVFDNYDSNDYREETKPVVANKVCPFYKRIESTRICVDAFNYGTISNCDAYFLSHFHYDHFIGLNKNFQNKLFCSQVTANLVLKRIRVDSKYITALELNDKFVNVYENDSRIRVKLIDANHCPGSVMYLFQINQNNNNNNPRYILHTGDFRASKTLVDNLKALNIKFEIVYLDTTYCDSNYSFLPQEQIVRLGVETVKKEIAKNPKCLIVCGSYTIGKERVFIAIAKELNLKIFVQREKYNILKCLDDNELNEMLTLNPNETNLHVIPMGKLNYRDLPEYLSQFPKYDFLIAIKPTGWTHKANKQDNKGLSVESKSKNFIMYGLEYSEHSSFSELKYFVQTLKPKRIIPTVNVGNKEYRDRMKSYFDEWTKQ